MKIDKIFLLDRIDSICKGIEAWANEGNTITPEMRDDLVKTVESDLKITFGVKKIRKIEGTVNLYMEDLDEDEILRMMEDEIDKKLAGASVAEIDVKKLKLRCKKNLRFLMRDLDQTSCYENLA